MKQAITLALLTLLLVPGLPSSAIGQDPPAVSSIIRAIRVDSGPRLDGRLDDEAWRDAPAFTHFRMAVPRSGDEPSERTELRVVFDASSLYIGVLCHDGEPSRISANTMAHDRDEAEDMGEDAVRVILDPFQDRRNAYYFSVNPRGAKSEGLATGEHSSLDWDGLWDARSAIGPDGWTVEIAIPFKSISFRPHLESWGLNVERVIARRLEIVRLSGARADAFFTNPAEAAPLEGLGEVRQGLGLD
jgi:hypothetical protein